jgi:hypothetical protein
MAALRYQGAGCRVRTVTQGGDGMHDPLANLGPHVRFVIYDP